MNSIERKWHLWRHTRKLAAAGRRPNLAIPYYTVSGHLELGDYTHFRNNPTFRAYGEGKIIFGDRCGTSWGVLIEAHELVRVENYVGIAEYTHITDTAWDLSGTTGGRAEARAITKPVVIGERSFVGSGCFIGPGVTIGESAVITPHSVVLRDVGPLEVWGGNPARKIAHRVEGVPESVRREVEAAIEAHGIGLDRYHQLKPARGLAKLFRRNRHD
jgi:acetyltransferase-like isoleucine patch superfamily enzyme